MFPVNLIIGSLLIILGILVKKFPNLIAGYNTMSPEQKEKVDVAGLSSHMRNSMVVMGVLILITFPLQNIFGVKEHGIGVFISIIFTGTFYMVILAQTYTSDFNQYKPIRKIIQIAAKSIIFVVLAALVFGLIYYGTKPSVYEVKGNQIEISGLYGITAQVKLVELRESIPKVIKRTNGFSYGSTLKGNFNLEGIGHCHLFIDSAEGPYIYLETESGSMIILNTKSKVQTEDLLKSIRSEMEK